MTRTGQRFARTLAAAFSIAALAMTGACGSDKADDATDDTDVDTSDITQLTVTPGTLTIATGEPAYEPWVLNDDPESGEGFEAALAYEVAERLGFDADDVVWTRTSFETAIAPGDKDWDLNIQQFGITDERRQAVDFSSPYFKDTRSIIVKADSEYADATSLADFDGAVIGATVGTQGYTIASERLTDDVQTFNDDASLAQALDAGQIDALVTDTTTCVYMVDSGEVTDGVVVGRIADSEDEEGMGIVLPQGSALTDAVTDVIDEMTEDGTLEELQETWLAEYTTDLIELA